MEQHFNLYYIFYTVAKCGNISAAARTLYISQPAISKAVSRLEQSLHTTLFIRSSRGVRLTESGEMLYRQVAHAFEAISQGEEQLRRMQKLGMGHLSIGASATLCKYVLLPILQQFTHLYPHVEISLSCQSTGETMVALEKGNVDIGLIGANEQPERLCFLPVMEIQDIFVATRAYLENLQKRTVHSGKLSARAIFSQSTLLMLNKENITRQYVDKYLLQENLVPTRIIEVTSMDLLIEFARIDLGIACVIQDFVQKDLESQKLLPLKLPVSIPKRAVGFAYMKNSFISPTMEKFLALFETWAKQRS